MDALNWNVQVGRAKRDPRAVAHAAAVRAASGAASGGTLNGSRHANIKELRFRVTDGEWRLAFAFDPARKAVLLVAADKSGGSGRRFYRALIRRADERFDRHLARLTKEGDS